MTLGLDALLLSFPLRGFDELFLPYFVESTSELKSVLVLPATHVDGMMQGPYFVQEGDNYAAFLAGLIVAHGWGPICL